MAKDIKNKSKNTPNANSDNLHEDQEKYDRQLFFDESHKETIQIQIQEVSKFTRYWSLIEENSMALVLILSMKQLRKVLKVPFTHSGTKSSYRFSMP